MKKVFNLLLIGMCLSMVSIAQPPQAFKYQVVVRNVSGELITDQPVSFRISIRDSSPEGTVLYMETHNATTNPFGLANLLIGEGTPTVGNFSTIDWGAGDRYLKVECDPAGGSSWISLGSSQLQSVPYALYAKNVEGWIKAGNNLLSTVSGNVGIGTANPNYKLVVNGGSFVAIHAFSTNSHAILGSSSGLGAAGVLGEATSADTWGVCGYNGFGGIAVRGYSPGGWGGYFYGDLYVSGNTGIGTTTPDNKLVIKTSGAGDVLKILSNTNYTLAKFRHTGNNSGALYLYDGSNNNTIFFYGDGNSFINSGSFGLGTASPSNAKLQIEGTGTYDAMLRMNNIGTDGASFFMGSTNSAWGGGTNSDRFVMGYGAPASDNIDLTINYGGDVGIGTTHPITKLDVSADGGVAVYGHSSGNAGVWGQSVSSYGVYGQSTTGWAGYFSGNVYVGGTLAKGGGSFVIDHPLDPENKLLRHNFVESPENLLIYRGKVKLDANGEALVELPDYFEALTKEVDATVTLTSVGRPFLTGYEWTGDFKSFKIYGESTREVSWVVYADRDDPVIHEIGRPVEEEKGGENTLCEKGKLLYPKAYGYPETAGRDYEMITNSKK